MGCLFGGFAIVSSFYLYVFMVMRWERAHIFVGHRYVVEALWIHVALIAGRWLG